MKSAVFAKITTIFKDINTSYFRNLDLWPLKTQNGLLHTYYFDMFGKIHQIEKGKNEKKTWQRNKSTNPHRLQLALTSVKAEY